MEYGLEINYDRILFMNKNYAFIDSQNVNLSIKSQGWSLDWSRFRIYLKEHYCIEKAYLFIGYLEGNNDLYSRLQEAGFICVFKPTLIDKAGKVKGNVDAELVLHSMIQFHNFKQAIIVTGDGDFYCLIEHLLKNDKLKTVLVPNQYKYSSLIKRFAKNKIAFMNELKIKLEYRN